MEVQDIFLDIALQFNSEYGTINVDLEEDDPSGVLLKSITAETLDETFLHYLKLLKTHLDNIDFLVLKMNSLNDKIKIPGQLNVSDCEYLELRHFYMKSTKEFQGILLDIGITGSNTTLLRSFYLNSHFSFSDVVNLKSLERALSVKMIRMTNVMIVLVNTDVNAVEGFVKILIQYYGCLTNLIKHFLAHHDPSDVNFNFLR